MERMSGEEEDTRLGGKEEEEEEGESNADKASFCWNLPIEVTEQLILSLLDPISAVKFGSTCRAFRGLVWKEGLWRSNDDEQQLEQVTSLRERFVDSVASFSGVYYNIESQANRGSIYYLALGQEEGSTGSGVVGYETTFCGVTTYKYFGRFRAVKGSDPYDDGSALILPYSRLELEFYVQILSEDGEDRLRSTLQPPQRRSLVFQRQSKQVPLLVPFAGARRRTCPSLQATMEVTATCSVPLWLSVWADNAPKKALLRSRIQDESSAGFLAYNLPSNRQFYGKHYT
ncbi:hypothetical protein QOT17_015192 [Balamuthia mandrillaris]